MDINDKDCQKDDVPNHAHRMQINGVIVNKVSRPRHLSLWRTNTGVNPFRLDDLFGGYLQWKHPATIHYYKDEIERNIGEI